VDVALAAPVEHREERVERLEPGSACLVLAERRPVDDVDPLDLHQTDRGSDAGALPHARPLPSAEGEVDAAVADGVQDAKREQHPALSRPRRRAAAAPRGRPAP
jgi:hypothetical protein